MERPYNQCKIEALLMYTSTLDKAQLPSLHKLEAEAIHKINAELDMVNANRPKSRRFKLLETLTPELMAVLALQIYHINLIPCAGSDTDPSYDVLGIYQDSGPDKGTYSTSEVVFQKLARALNAAIKIQQVKEFMQALRDMAERKCLCMDPDLIAVNNGIFDYRSKTLLPFSPDIVFLSKSHVDYKPNAQNIRITNPDDGTLWDVVSWIEELSDDPEIVDLLWKLFGAVLRPNVPWGKSALLYSNQGNNGKGTLCEAMRSLLGPGACVSIPISNFSKEFAMEPLLRASAIITDENSVGEFCDDVANLKAIVTNDVIQVNRKFKMPIAFRFRGFVVQCINDLPRIKDKSESFYRRQLFIPFEKCFTGRERKYIKTDYLHRPEVLEYILWRVLNMDYYSLPEPLACKALLDEYREYNDPVRQFALEMLPQCKWDLLPFTFLYDLYKAWFRKNSPSGKVQGRNTFIDDIVALLPILPDWSCPDKAAKIRSRNRMDCPEPLIAEYDLTSWKNPIYTGGDIDRQCTPVLLDTYRGILRVVPNTALPVTSITEVES